jgi:ribose transport system substrate-binding protein
MKKLHCMTWIMAGLWLLVLSGCQRTPAPQEAGPTVALVLKTLNNPYFIDMQKGAERGAKPLGVQLIIQAPERELDVEKQMQIVENLIQRKVDAICLTPAGSREVVPAIVKANRAGIPVLIIDTRVDAAALQQAGGRVTTFIGSDNFEGGQIAGKYLREAMGNKGQVAVLEGIPGHETGDARLRGFRQALGADSGVEIVASQTANWERDQGFNVFQNILQSHPQVQALFACNDLMALGAVEAIAAAGKSGKITVVGFDAVSDAREAIRAGKIQASVAQHPDLMGQLAVENAYKVIRGQAISNEIPVTVELITIKNVGQP